jgi:hypothetical protein
MKPSLSQSKLSLALLGLALLLMACRPGKPAPTAVLTLFPILPTPTLPGPPPPPPPAAWLRPPPPK